MNETNITALFFLPVWRGVRFVVGFPINIMQKCLRSQRLQTCHFTHYFLYRYLCAQFSFLPQSVSPGIFKTSFWLVLGKCRVKIYISPWPPYSGSRWNANRCKEKASLYFLKKWKNNKGYAAHLKYKCISMQKSSPIFWLVCLRLGIRKMPHSLNTVKGYLGEI